MSQSKKKKPDNRAVEKTPALQTIDKAPRRSWTGFIIASVVIAIILIIVGVFYYQERVAPFHQTIITVDNISINMDYFLKRARLAGADPMSMLSSLAKEQVIKLEAPRYVGEVSPEDIDQALRYTSNTTSESEFKAWYRQMLNENGLSDSEYREMMRTSLLSARFHVYLAERVPTVAEQIHLHAIILATLEDAEKTRARWEAGEDFADLAREVSLDEESREKGGDLGWFPRGVLDYSIEYAAFDLSTDNVSESLAYYDVSDTSSTEPLYWYLLMVSEKADARELDEDRLEVLRSRALEDWLTAEWQLHEIHWHGLHSENFDSETYAWLNYQLSKNQPSSTQTSSGEQ
jgi:foldase protein PrsA